MKVINKLVCFLFVFILCVPFFCFNVSAEDSTSYDYSYLYGTDFSGKYSSFFISQLKEVSNGPFLDGSSETGKPNLRKSDYWKEDTNGLKTNYIGWVEPNTSDYYVMDNNINNVLLLAFAQSQWGYWKDNSKPIYYYCYSYVYKESDIQIYKNYEFYFSNSPLTFRSCTNSYCDYVKLNSIDSCHVSVYTFLDELDGVSYPNAYAGSGLAINSTAVCGTQITSGNEICFKSGDYGQVMIEEQYVNSSRESQFKCNLNCYSFISSFSNHDIDSSCFSSGTVDNVSDIASDKTLSDQIDVKLTPHFCLDMDRFDPLSNQTDYFKFEITNNSDSAIQWCAGIYDPELVTVDTMDILSLSSWAYVCRSTYYDFSVKEDKGIFRTTYTYSGTLKTGSFDSHYLEPGETFSDLIFWENINIKPNVIYHFFVNAVKTDLNYATLNIDPPVTEESSDIHSVTVIEDTYYNTILEGASDFKELVCNIYNIEFSCLSMPAFTTTVRGGNSVLNTSGNDRYQLYNNYETVSDINGLDTKINKNYTDPAILANTFNRSDVSVDIDSFSVDDVKSYITSCQSFFILIKEALLSFPAFIWALICFGLTGLIVIAVVKALL